MFFVCHIIVICVSLQLSCCKVCNDIAIEPPLQYFSEEVINLQSAWLCQLFCNSTGKQLLCGASAVSRSGTASCSFHIIVCFGFWAIISVIYGFCIVLFHNLFFSSAGFVIACRTRMSAWCCVTHCSWHYITDP